MAVLFRLETADGAPAEPPRFETAMPNWSAGDTIPLGARTLRVLGQLRSRSLRRLRGTSHPFGGSAAMRDAVESRPNSRPPLQGPKRQGVCGFHKF
jgi:hypothetical protein